jgi:hypothetical protein
MRVVLLEYAYPEECFATRTRLTGSLDGIGPDSQACVKERLYWPGVMPVPR